jgi:hypothetical protein
MFKKRLLVLTIALVFTLSVFPSEWDYIIDHSFAYVGKLNSNQFKQYGITSVTENYHLAREHGFSTIQIDKIPNQVSLFIENMLNNYKLETSDVYIFNIQSSKSSINGTLRIIRKLTGLSYEFYATHIM